MTRHLEDRMTAIAEGRATLAEVVDESRRDLHEVLAELRAHQPSLVRWLRDATFLEKDYDPCDACPDGRMVRRRARNGWSFLGCSRYTACRRRLRRSAQGQRLPWTEPESLPETMRLPSPTPAACLAATSADPMAYFIIMPGFIMPLTSRADMSCWCVSFTCICVILTISFSLWLCIMKPQSHCTIFISIMFEGIEATPASPRQDALG